MDKLCKHCKKTSVAEVNLSSPSVHSMLTMRSASPKQKESRQLVDLCNDLAKRLGDRSLTPQQHKYEDIKRQAVCRPSFYAPLT